MSRNNINKNSTASTSIATGNSKTTETQSNNNKTSQPVVAKPSASNVQAKITNSPNQIPPPEQQSNIVYSMQSKRSIETVSSREAQPRKTTIKLSQPMQAKPSLENHVTQLTQSRNSNTRKVQAQNGQKSHNVTSLEDKQDYSNRSNLTKSSLLRERKSQEKEPAQIKDDTVVTFAGHIRVNDDQAGQYTFGFFDEQPISQEESSNRVKSNESQQENIKQTKVLSQKPELKHLKASPNSEEKCYKSNDNIDANSFNYHQILEFISTGEYLFAGE